MFVFRCRASLCACVSVWRLPSMDLQLPVVSSLCVSAFSYGVLPLSASSRGAIHTVCLPVECSPLCLSACGVFPTASVFTSRLPSKGSCLFVSSRLVTAAVLWGEGPPCFSTTSSQLASSLYMLAFTGTRGRVFDTSFWGTQFNRQQTHTELSILV